MQQSPLTRRSRRRALIVLACLAGLVIAYALGASRNEEPSSSAAGGATTADLRRAEAEAEKRYAAGVAEGRAEFAPGTPAYRRIKASGVRAGRKAMARRIAIQYAKGVKAGKAAAQKSYESGQEAGYDSGYDEGWEVGYDEGLNDGLDSAPSVSSDAEDSPDVGYDLDCADFSGPVDVSPGDPHGLDADGDGVGCE